MFNTEPRIARGLEDLSKLFRFQTMLRSWSFRIKTLIASYLWDLHIELRVLVPIFDLGWPFIGETSWSITFHWWILFIYFQWLQRLVVSLLLDGYAWTSLIRESRLAYLLNGSLQKFGYYITEYIEIAELAQKNQVSTCISAFRNSNRWVDLCWMLINSEPFMA